MKSDAAAAATADADEIKNTTLQGFYADDGVSAGRRGQPRGGEVSTTRSMRRGTDEENEPPDDEEDDGDEEDEDEDDEDV